VPALLEAFVDIVRLQWHKIESRSRSKGAEARARTACVRWKVAAHTDTHAHKQARTSAETAPSPVGGWNVSVAEPNSDATAVLRTTRRFA
jgi:hypothetical protein